MQFHPLVVYNVMKLGQEIRKSAQFECLTGGICLD